MLSAKIFHLLVILDSSFGKATNQEGLVFVAHFLLLFPVWCLQNQDKCILTRDCYLGRV